MATIIIILIMWFIIITMVLIVDTLLKQKQHHKISGYTAMKEHYSKMSRLDQKRHKHVLKQIKKNLKDTDCGILALREIELATKLFKMREQPKTYNSVRNYLENEIEIVELTGE